MLKDARTVTPADVQEAASDGFNAVVGKNKPHATCEIAAATGLCDSYWAGVKGYSRTPSLNALVGGANAMTVEARIRFLTPILELMGLTGLRPIEATEACPHKVTGDLADAIRLIAEALEDGEFDDRERFEVAARLRTLSSKADGIAPVRRVA